MGPGSEAVSMKIVAMATTSICHAPLCLWVPSIILKYLYLTIHSLPFPLLYTLSFTFPYPPHPSPMRWVAPSVVGLEQEVDPTPQSGPPLHLQDTQGRVLCVCVCVCVCACVCVCVCVCVCDTVCVQLHYIRNFPHVLDTVVIY